MSKCTVVPTLTPAFRRFAVHPDGQATLL